MHPGEFGICHNNEAHVLDDRSELLVCPCQRSLVLVMMSMWDGQVRGQTGESFTSSSNAATLNSQRRRYRSDRPIRIESDSYWLHPWISNIGDVMEMLKMISNKENAQVSC